MQRQKGLFGDRTQTPQEDERLQREQELRKRKGLLQQLQQDYDQQWATLEALARLAQEVTTLCKGTLTPADLPYSADYPRIVEIVAIIGTRVAESKTELALPEDLHPTKAEMKKLTIRTRQLGEAIGAIQHLFWAVKSKLKHRTVLAEGKLQVVRNEAVGTQAIVQCIEEQCTA